MVYIFRNGISRQHMRKFGLLLVVALFALTAAAGVFSPVKAEVNSVTPSTNDINRTNGWAYVDQLSSSVGSTTLRFTSSRSFGSCFEYRTDGDTSQKTSDTNYNTLVTDGLYPFYCQNNNSSTHIINASSYVEVRMVFGAEADERFDWTRFELPYNRNAEITAPTSNQNVYGEVNFAAFLDDDDVDSISWAVRQGTCAAGTNTVLGNVDGRHDAAALNTSDLSRQSFSFTGDMSSMSPGKYCFVYNPAEDSGETNIRLTREFNLLAPLTDKSVCRQNGWVAYGIFKNQGDCVSLIATNGRNLPSQNI